MREFVAANPFVRRMYPNAVVADRAPAPAERGRLLAATKSVLELALQLPSPLVEACCRRLYAWHLGRRAASWRSPEQVRLQSDYLKLHTRSHRSAVLDRFDAAVDLAIERATRVA
jgi:hypothetical protein